MPKKQPQVLFKAAGSVLWPDPKRGPYRITCTWANIDGYSRLVGIDVDGSLPDGKGGETVTTLSAAEFRRIPLYTVADRVLATIRERSSQFDVGPDPGDGVKVTGRPTPSGRSGRPPTLTRSDHERVAQLYRTGGANPTKHVAEELHLSRSAASERVRKARDAGLLERSSQGRPGGPSGRTKAKSTKKVGKR